MNSPDQWHGFDPSFISDDRAFLQSSQMSSKKYEVKSQEIVTNLENGPWVKDPNLSILVREANDGIVNAEAKPAEGVVSVSEAVMNSWPNPIAKATLYHERTHLQVGSEIRRFLLENFADVDQFFHKKLIPGWINGEIALKGDQEYSQSSRDWQGLFETGSAAYVRDEHEFIAALNAYFIALKKNLIRVSGGKIAYVPSPQFTSWKKEISEAQEIPIEQQFLAKPEETAIAVVSGYEVAEELERRYRNFLEQKYRLSLFELEEGFTNFVGCSLAEYDIDQLNQVFRQDEGKIVLAKKITAASKERGITPSEALDRVKSYQDLVQYCQSIEIIRQANS